METGTVQFFTINEHGGYGFLKLESGEKLYFERNDGGPVNPGRDEPVVQTWQQVREPRKGAQICFLRSRNRRGQKAAPWCFEEEWTNAEAEVVRESVQERLSSMSRLAREIDTSFTAKDVTTAKGRLCRLLTEVELLETAPDSWMPVIQELASVSHVQLIAQARDTVKQFTRRVQQCEVAIGADHAKEAKALATRFAANISNSNLGAAHEAHLQLCGGNLRLGLDHHLGSQAEAANWLQWASEALTNLHQKVQTRQKRKSGRVQRGLVKR